MIATAGGGAHRSAERAMGKKAREKAERKAKEAEVKKK